MRYGASHSEDLTVTLTPPGADPITATQTSYADDVWTGTLVIPPSGPAGTCTVTISGAKDTLGNELTADTGGEGEGGDEGGGSAQTEIEFIGDPPEAQLGQGEPEPGSSAMYLDLLTTSSYVSPAYVQGTKSENVVALRWKYHNESKTL